MNYEMIAPSLEEFSAYKKFGWKYADESFVPEGVVMSHSQFLVRDKDMPNYQMIVALEQKYFSLKKSMAEYEPMNYLLAVVLLVIGVLPFFIYLIFRCMNKNNVYNYNESIRKQMESVAKEAQALLQNQ